MFFIYYMFHLIYHLYWWNHGLSYVGLPDELEDVRILLDQCSETEFEWMSYANSEIISCIPLEVLENQEMWNVKVALVVYAIVVMQESDRVL
ncbi:hypothetical protein Gogos_017953 [Gossypium gossypioides]|uniref:Aminotransferase-like plant mobile domain-containing protein n=1 Tax=Gossypium gossypioides TaxID=34282 RepID=A0A7J9BE52_GOSGO|nr:hypothetical protein [Gossypium gossypioides]